MQVKSIAWYLRLAVRLWFPFLFVGVMYAGYFFLQLNGLTPRLAAIDMTKASIAIGFVFSVLAWRRKGKASSLPAATFQTFSAAAAALAAIGFYDASRVPIMIMLALTVLLGSIGLAHMARKYNSLHRNTFWELLLPFGIGTSLYMDLVGFGLWVFFVLVIPVCIQTAIALMWHKDGQTRWQKAT